MICGCAEGPVLADIKGQPPSIPLLVLATESKAAAAVRIGTGMSLRERARLLNHARWDMLAAMSVVRRFAASGLDGTGQEKQGT